ncbi:hypothetical protein SAMN02983003_1060 [Devosia enhydra]|uniref:Uncharacterized protein n=1 Tax=Devosia enhydra TaxID=665118 RepID=A0A1K2HVI7_9HYPH|nr:hypothetical protein [Devosia enhydra]SFZ82407.1 hypothetical protein SAMN02983003_1060 [Devosia enhydra]
MRKPRMHPLPPSPLIGHFHKAPDGTKIFVFFDLPENLERIERLLAANDPDRLHRSGHVVIVFPEGVSVHATQ